MDPASLEGRSIDNARPMTVEERRFMGWENRGPDDLVVLVLDDGTKLFPSRDWEGNGPGELFAINPDGDQTSFFFDES